MKQTFDIVSHFFAILPLAVLSSTLYRGAWKSSETKFSALLLVFLLVAVACSLAYHSVDKSFQSFDTLHAIDRFTSSTIIILTFWLYIDRIKIPTVIALVVMLVLVVFEAYDYIVSEVVEGAVVFLVFVAIIVFALNKYEYSEYFRRDTERERIYEFRDPFFGSFFLTQIVAIFFFLADVDPYYHSLWHVFAFISLGSVLIHSLPGSGNTFGQNSREFYVVLIYWLGSLPSRLFISFIFIDLGQGEGYISLFFLLLTFFMLVRVLMNYNTMTRRRIITTVKGFISYLVVTLLLITGSIGAAGWVLFADTLVSASVWVYFEVYYHPQGKKREESVPKKNLPALQLRNMVF